MPYGRKSLTRARRPRRTYRRRSTAAPRPYKKRPSAWTNRSLASKALSLARLNNKLAYGSFQSCLQHFAADVNLNAWTPICFNLTTPTVGEPVHQYLPNGVGNGYDIATATTFAHPSLTQMTGNGPSGSGGYEPWNQWRYANDDVLNGKYKLLTQKLEFHFGVNSSSTNCRIRIDFVKPKYNRMLRLTQPGGIQVGDAHLLPDSIGSFVNIVGPDNMINPMYWKTVKTVFKTLNSENNTTAPQTQKSVFFRHNKVINPISAASNVFPSAKISLPNQLWCIISTDFRGGSTVGQPFVNVKRHITWRDGQGHAA